MSESPTPERWAQIQRLFDEVADLDPAARQARLDEVCAADPELRVEVESLLASYAGADDLLYAGLGRLVDTLAPASGASAIAAGARVAHYTVLEPLGRGGMGAVYKAHDTRLERFVALKFLSPWLHPDAASKRRFVQEARAASALDHPNICTVHEIGDAADGTPYIAMAFYEGETLKEKIGRGPLAWRQALEYAREILLGLAHAHAAGIVHRDIKPANVIVTRGGAVRILDFGLAKVADARLTGAGMTVGTVGYASPEQARGQTIDQRSDLWSLGVVLYEMLSGECPFRGEPEHAVINAVLTLEPAPLSASESAFPPALQRVVAKCLAKDPEARYPDAGALLEDLDALLGERAPPGVRGAAPAPPRAEPPSVAVLPFADLSPAGDQEYFSDGMAEELSNALAGIEGWRVMSRTSAFAFKGTGLDACQIGRRLGVSHILTGSVRKSGERLRIRTELVNVGDGFQVWSQHYDRELEDVFTIQEDIARAVVDKLRVALIGQPPGALVKHYTENLDAWHLYLKARFHLNKRSESGLLECHRYCEQAIAEDAGYALAYAALADSLVLQGFHGTAAPVEVMPRARAAAEQALRLDPELAEAHTSLGCVRAAYEWDWQGARSAFEQALALNANHATTHHWYAVWYLMPNGLFDEALASLARAQRLDPASSILGAAIGWCHLLAGHADEAIAALHRTLDLDADFVVAHDLLGQSYLQQGRLDEALAALQQAVRLSAARPLSLASLGHACALAGRGEDATQILEALSRPPGVDYVSAYDVALVHAGLGRDEAALDWLEKAHREHSGWLCFLAHEPRLRALRARPRFRVLLEAVGLRG